MLSGLAITHKLPKRVTVSRLYPQYSCYRRLVWAIRFTNAPSLNRILVAAALFLERLTPIWSASRRRPIRQNGEKVRLTGRKCHCPHRSVAITAVIPTVIAPSRGRFARNCDERQERMNRPVGFW